MKKFKDLNLSNAYLFAAALSDEITCQLILEVLLGHPVPQIKVKAEHSVLISSDFRSIRLDVYARDKVEVGYNLEMQNDDARNLPKRSRYHQAQLDVISLKPGEDFSELKPSYIIFICTFDPFGEKLYRYSFEERCLERDMGLGDETKKIFLSTCGENQVEVSEELVQFLHYVENSSQLFVEQTGSQTLERIHQRILQLKQSRELEAGYMTMEELLQEKLRQGIKVGRAEGMAEGRAEGMAEGRAEAEAESRTRLFAILRMMRADGMEEQIPHLETDETFYQEMLEKYQI